MLHCPGKRYQRAISGFHRGVREVFALLGFFYTPLVGIYPTFRGNLSVPASRVKKSKKILLGLLNALRWDRQVVPKVGNYQ